MDKLHEIYLRRTPMCAECGFDMVFSPKQSNQEFQVVFCTNNHCKGKNIKYRLPAEKVEVELHHG